MPSLGAEVTAVQSPMLCNVGQIGWEFVAQRDALKRRGGESGLVFVECFTDQFIAFNKVAGLNDGA